MGRKAKLRAERKESKGFDISAMLDRVYQDRTAEDCLTWLKNHAAHELSLGGDADFWMYWSDDPNVKAIGRRLNDLGGVDLMKSTAMRFKRYSVFVDAPNAITAINTAWRGIGSWTGV